MQSSVIQQAQQLLTVDQFQDLINVAVTSQLSSQLAGRATRTWHYGVGAVQAKDPETGEPVPIEDLEAWIKLSADKIKDSVLVLVEHVKETRLVYEVKVLDLEFKLHESDERLLTLMTRLSATMDETDDPEIVVRSGACQHPMSEDFDMSQIPVV